MHKIKRGAKIKKIVPFYEYSIENVLGKITNGKELLKLSNRLQIHASFMMTIFLETLLHLLCPLHVQAFSLIGVIYFVILYKSLVVSSY